VGDRDDVLARIAGRLAALDLGHPARVGVDGICGAGKTRFAADLADVLEARGTPVIRLDSDGFHHLRAHRYRQGRRSARGYYEDAYDFTALAERVLRPLGPGGDLVYATAVHDLAGDAAIDGAVAVADPRAVLLFACTFLQRGDLRELWDEVVYLDASVAAARQRGISRDRDALGGAVAAAAAYDDRYLAAWELYREQEDPRGRASIVVRHDDPANPVLLPAG
jgi:uridine kinase